MIKDLEMLYNITPLFEKELIIWGAGYDGSTILEDIIQMRAGKHGITVCDSDWSKWGGEVCDIEIISPFTLEEYLKNSDLNNIIICIMVQDLKLQDEILKEIKEMGLGEPDIYTSFGVRCGIYYGLKSPYINMEFRQRKITENMTHLKQMRSAIYNKTFEYLAYLPLHNDEIIMVYQPEDAGCCSMYASIKQYGRNVLDIRPLQNVKYIDVEIQKLLDLKSGKIISLVKEPISSAMSYMWDNISLYGAHGSIPDIREIEDSCFGKGSKNVQLEWYTDQMQKLFGINVLTCPFNREKGYQVIKSGNIELLLVKTERLDELISIIGEFLGIQDFQFYKTNIRERRYCRFAYEQYVNQFLLSYEKVDSIFREDPFVRHFYTEAECESFIVHYGNEGTK